MANPVIVVNISMLPQNKDVKFVIIDSTTQKPLSDAYVQLFEAGQQVFDMRSDGMGVVLLNNAAPNKSYTFTCDKDGYAQYSGTLQT